MCNTSDLAGQDRTKACAVIQCVGVLSWEVTLGKAVPPLVPFTCEQCYDSDIFMELAAFPVLPGIAPWWAADGWWRNASVVVYECTHVTNSALLYLS